MAQAAADNGAPQWYCRILKLRAWDEDLDDVYPDCKCDEQDIGCYCDELCEPNESKLRDGKYTGPDAAHFYEVKAYRSLRKHDVADAQVRKEEEKQERWKLDRDKENKVLEDLKELTESGADNDQPAELDLLANRHFDLYCLKFTELWWDDYDYFPTAYIEFYDLSKQTNLGVPISLEDDGILGGESMDDEDRNKTFNPDDKKLNIRGHIYYNVLSGCDFSRFDPLQYVGLEDCVLKEIAGRLDSNISFMSTDYLILTVPGRRAFNGPDQWRRISKNPKTFTFVGIRRDSLCRGANGVVEKRKQ